MKCEMVVIYYYPEFSAKGIPGLVRTVVAQTVRCVVMGRKAEVTAGGGTSHTSTPASHASTKRKMVLVIEWPDILERVAEVAMREA